jgi:hypothetical protein
MSKASAPYILVVVMLLAFAVIAEAQQKNKIPRISVLEPTGEGTCNKGFRLGLLELGYVEKQNILLEQRAADAKPARLRELAGELAQLKPDVIWTHSLPRCWQLKRPLRRFRSRSEFLVTRSSSEPFPIWRVPAEMLLGWSCVTARSVNAWSYSSKFGLPIPLSVLARADKVIR